MRVLGISPLDKDATVSFLEDGHVVFACAEERLSRVKLQSGFPHRALELGFQRTGWDAGSIDAVAYAFLDGAGEARLIREAAAHDREFQSRARSAAASQAFLDRISRNYEVDRAVRIPGLESREAEFLPEKPWWKRWAYRYASASALGDGLAHRSIFNHWMRAAIADHAHWSQVLERELAHYDLLDKLQRFPHHDTHAANAFYASGFDNALVLVLDGYGSGMCGGVFTAGPQGIRNLHRYRFPHSLGVFYEQVTSALGFRPSRHEGKIVGLAAYGNPDLLAPVLLSRFVQDDGDIQLAGAQNHFLPRALATRFAKRDVAAAYQRVLEQVTCRSVAWWLAKTGQTKIVMSGGVHANVKLNQRVRELPGVESVFVYPNMGDGGCGTGAAMLALGHGRMARVAFSTVHFGPEYGASEILDALNSERLQFDRCGDIDSEVARLLSQNTIVGRFSGRMEYGPRALGNRSILYPAHDPGVNQWLNQQLGRTEFMPFAPAVLASSAKRFFHRVTGCEKTAEFMTITFDCTDEMLRTSPAAVHVDGTARPQLVTPQSNPGFHRVLQAYESLTGIPVIINTSFNMHEEPIVCTPADAVRAFLQGNLDYLAIGEFLVPHPRLNVNRRERQIASGQTFADPVVMPA